jgi:hypothetical protein
MNMADIPPKVEIYHHKVDVGSGVTITLCLVCLLLGFLIGSLI